MGRYDLRPSKNDQDESDERQPRLPGAIFSYIGFEDRVAQTHPLRELRAVVAALLATMNREFEAVYALRGMPSVPPEMLLKALLLQILFSIRSELSLFTI